MPFKYPSMTERIIANSVLSYEFSYKGDPCWNWVGKVSANRSGMLYGRIAIRIKYGRRKGKVKSWLAHRAVVVFIKGRRMTPRMKAMHLCNNSLCVNPAHLVGGSQRSNVRQCVREGRHRNRHSERSEPHEISQEASCD